MSIVDRPIADAATGLGRRLLTVADLAALPLDLPSGTVDYELDDGRLVFISPAGHRHGNLTARLAAQFTLVGERRGHGLAYADVGVVLWRNPDRVVAPDAAFVSTARLPVRETPEGYLETIPDLVVEVRSKNDTLAELAHKAEDYLRAGVRIVWVVDGEARSATVYGPNSSPQTLTDGDVLRAADVIPGLELAVADVFDPPSR